MKKLFTVAAALSVAVFAAPMVKSEAAPANGSYCNMAKSQRNPVAWNSYYGCLEKSPRVAAAAAPARETRAKNVSREAPAKSPYCNMAKSQRNPVAWNSYYGCLGTPPRTAAAAPPVREARATSSYCNMAKSQRNPVAWNEFYGCLNR